MTVRIPKAPKESGSRVVRVPQEMEIIPPPEAPDSPSQEDQLASFNARARFWAQNPKEFSEEMAQEVLVQLQKIMDLSSSAEKASDRLKASAAFLDWARPIAVALGARLAMEGKIRNPAPALLGKGGK